MIVSPAIEIDVAVSLGAVDVGANRCPGSSNRRYRQPVVFYEHHSRRVLAARRAQIDRAGAGILVRLPDIKNGQPLLIFLSDGCSASLGPSLLAPLVCPPQGNSEISDILPLVRKFQRGRASKSSLLPELAGHLAGRSRALGARRDQPGKNPEAAIQSVKQAFSRASATGDPLPMEQLLPILNKLLPVTANLRGS